MTEDEKKLQQTQPSQPATPPSVYGGAFDQEISDLYGQISNRPNFHYSVDGDALFQQYKNKYTENAKRSMKDTMGKAASLTGGYGSTYTMGVGQQAYDEQMRGLTDMLPELEGRAFDRYQKEGDTLLQRYNMANQLGAADQATRQHQQEWDFQQKQYADTQTQKAYGNLTSAILTSGYQPTAEELNAAGMTQQEANSLRQAWIASNPDQAWMLGILSAGDYYKLTGKQPAGAPAPAVQYVYYDSSKKKKKSTDKNVETPASVNKADARKSTAPVVVARVGTAGYVPLNWREEYTK